MNASGPGSNVCLNLNLNLRGPMLTYNAVDNRSNQDFVEERRRYVYV